jgi:hypothetical protein
MEAAFKKMPPLSVGQIPSRITPAEIGIARNASRWPVRDGWTTGPDSFGDSKAGSIANRQDHPMLIAVDATKEPRHFLRTEDDGQLLWLLTGWDDFLDSPSLLERNLVEEANGGAGTRIELADSFFSFVKYSWY